MKIALRCIYHKAVTPNFLIIDLDAELWPKFLWGDNHTRKEIIRPYLPNSYPQIREVAWIPIGDLSDSNKATLIINLINR